MRPLIPAGPIDRAFIPVKSAVSIWEKALVIARRNRKTKKKYLVRESFTGTSSLEYVDDVMNGIHSFLWSADV